MDNNKDFFDGLSQTITKTAKDLGDMLNSGIETQKLRTRILGEERAIEKLKIDIGSLVYSRYDSGEVYDGELGRLCLAIADHYGKIRRMENENAKFRGKKICPSCRKEIPVECLFCPNCGTPCQDQESQAESQKDDKIVPFTVEEEEDIFAEETAETTVQEEEGDVQEEVAASVDPTSQEEAPTSEDTAPQTEENPSQTEESTAQTMESTPDSEE